MSASKLLWMESVWRTGRMRWTPMDMILHKACREQGGLQSDDLRRHSCITRGCTFSGFLEGVGNDKYKTATLDFVRTCHYTSAKRELGTIALSFCMRSDLPKAAYATLWTNKETNEFNLLTAAQFFKQCDKNAYFPCSCDLLNLPW